MTSIVLMNNVSTFEATSDAWRIDQWIPHNGGWFTVSFTVDNFHGNIWLEASLASQTTEQDWFPIWLNTIHPYISFPLNPKIPTGYNGGDSRTVAHKFQGNLLWIRARLERNHLTNHSITGGTYGVIKQIIVSI
jgi:hypothetical protein